MHNRSCWDVDVPSRLISCAAAVTLTFTVHCWTISPAYLLPCNKDGVLQLRLMKLPQYRARLARMLGEPITAPQLADCDFFSTAFQIPARVVADMELRQVFRTAQQARAAGYHGLLLAAFESQKRFLSQIFPPPFFHIAVIDEQALCILEMGADL